MSPGRRERESPLKEPKNKGCGQIKKSAPQATQQIWEKKKKWNPSTPYWSKRSGVGRLPGEVWKRLEPFAPHKGGEGTMFHRNDRETGTRQFTQPRALPKIKCISAATTPSGNHHGLRREPLGPFRGAPAIRAAAD